MKVVSYTIVLLLLLGGCATKQDQPITVVEYVTVEVPVVYKIKRPSRPTKYKQQSVTSYLNDLVSYTKMLEVIIDQHNKETD